MYLRCFVLFVFLFWNAPGFGEKTEPELNLLEAAIEETESDGKSLNESSVISQKKRKKQSFWRLPAKKTKKRKRKLSSSLKPKDFDLGDVVITVSERKMEDIPAMYPKTSDRKQSAAVLKIKGKPVRRTSSLPKNEENEETVSDISSKSKNDGNQRKDP